MICYLCGNEATQGKTYTFSSEAKKTIPQLGISQAILFVCEECCTNPLRQLAQTLLDMFFWGSPKQRIETICQMFKSGSVRLPRGISIAKLRKELKKRSRKNE